MQKNNDENTPSADDSIVMIDDNGEEVVFNILEETRIGGMDYILVTDAGDDEDGECYILKDVSKREEDEAVYEFVENEDELDYMFKIFTELMDGSETTLER